MDGGAWWAAVHGIARSRTRLSDFTFTFHFHALEKEMETHSSVFAWRVPGTGEPGGLPSMGSHRVRHDWSDLAAAAAEFIFSYLNIHFSTFSLVPYVSFHFKKSWNLILLYFYIFVYYLIIVLKNTSTNVLSSFIKLLILFTYYFSLVKTFKKLDLTNNYINLDFWKKALVLLLQRCILLIFYFVSCWGVIFTNSFL